MKKVLLVDDEPDLVRLVAKRLLASGYDVATAYDGHAALEQVATVSPDVIILDLMLPKVDGYKVCRLLKFDERYRKIPVLIFTARAREEDIQMARECGADGYLTKPFSSQILLDKLTELLAQAAARAGAP